ncbi:MAG: YceI family protein [Candidatus Neomarinimicrobiota bacterium]|nr:MAG: YceI family protein [Candidatus Neomarinimicrobiota bacterium]
MKKRLLLVGSAALPVFLAAGLVLSQNQGRIGGTGFARTHTFPVIAEQFDVQISDPDTSGYRQIAVAIPVSQLNTNIGLRNMHMKTAIFKGKEFPLVTYQARTQAPLEPGTVTLEGTLTINGIQESHPLTVELVQQDGVLHAVGSTLVHPTHFDMPLVGMGPMKLLDKVDMSFDIALQ